MDTKSLFLAMLVTPGILAAQQCFELIDAKGVTIYKEASPPFSLAWPAAADDAQTASKRRGEHLVIHTVPCEPARLYWQPSAPRPFGLSPANRAAATDGTAEDSTEDLAESAEVLEPWDLPPPPRHPPGHGPHPPGHAHPSDREERPAAPPKPRPAPHPKPRPVPKPPENRQPFEPLPPPERPTQPPKPLPRPGHPARAKPFDLPDGSRPQE